MISIQCIHIGITFSILPKVILNPSPSKHRSDLTQQAPSRHAKFNIRQRSYMPHHENKLLNQIRKTLSRVLVKMMKMRLPVLRMILMGMATMMTMVSSISFPSPLHVHSTTGPGGTSFFLTQDTRHTTTLLHLASNSPPKPKPKPCPIWTAANSNKASITLSKKESQPKVHAQSMYSCLTSPNFWLCFLTAEVRF